MFVCDLREMAIKALAFLGNKLFVSVSFLGIQFLCKLWDWYLRDWVVSLIGPSIGDEPAIPEGVFEGDFTEGFAQAFMPSWGTVLRYGSSSAVSLAAWALAQG